MATLLLFSNSKLMCSGLMKNVIGSGNRPTGNATHDQGAVSQTFQTTLSYAHIDLHLTQLPTPIPAGHQAKSAARSNMAFVGGKGAPSVVQTCMRRCAAY